MREPTIPIIWFMLIVCPSFASLQPTESRRQELKVQLLLNAKSERALKKTAEQIRKWDEMKMRCDIELDTAQSPFSCFLQFKIEKQLGFINSDTFRRLTLNLESICMDSLEKREFFELGPLEPSACSKKAKWIQERRRYRQQADNPKRFLYESY